jgi:hypothetical protein
MEPLCNEIHKHVDERLKAQEKVLDAHGTQLDELAITQATQAQITQNLCGKIDDLVQIVKWFIGLIIGAYISFFFFVIQTKLFH